MTLKSSSILSLSYSQEIFTQQNKYVNWKKKKGQLNGSSIAKTPPIILCYVCKTNKSHAGMIMY